MQTLRPSTELNDSGGGGGGDSQIITVVINQPQLTPAHPMREGVVPESPADWRYVDPPSETPGGIESVVFAQRDSRRRGRKKEKKKRKRGGVNLYSDNRREKKGKERREAFQ